MSEAKDTSEFEIASTHIHNTIERAKKDQVRKAFTQSDVRKGEYQENKDEAIGNFMKIPIKEANTRDDENKHLAIL